METISEIRLCVATAGDVPALLKLVQGAYRGDDAAQGWTHEAHLLDGQRTDTAALMAIIDDDNGRILLASSQDTLIGCVHVSMVGEGVGYLGMLAVAPLRQAGGVGRQLIEAAESAAADLFGATAMEMTVIRQRADLIAYYERRGYLLTEETREFPYDDNRFGLPKVADLEFAVLVKTLG